MDGIIQNKMENNNLIDWLEAVENNQGSSPEEVHENREDTPMNSLANIGFIKMEKLKLNAQDKQWSMKNEQGDEIAYIVKKPNGIKDKLFGSFSKVVYDLMDQPLFKMKRDAHYRQAGKCTVLSPDDVVMGYVQVTKTPLGWSFKLQDSEKTTFLRVEKLKLSMKELAHKIKKNNGEKIGKIAIESQKTLFRPKLELTFPMDLDINLKYTIIAAAMIIHKSITIV